MNITDFLLARIEEDEKAALSVDPEDESSHVRQSDSPYDATRHTFQDPSAQDHYERHNPARVLAECAAKRAIIDFHKNWPVLAQTLPSIETHLNASDLDTNAVRATQQIQWLTQQEYVNRFGEEPPTAPMLKELAAVYADHPDYREEWRP